MKDKVDELRDNKPKDWQRFEKLWQALRPLQQRYAKEALKETINIFGKDFPQDYPLRLSLLAQMQSVDLAVAMELVDFECKQAQKKRKKK